MMALMEEGARLARARFDSLGMLLSLCRSRDGFGISGSMVWELDLE